MKRVLITANVQLDLASALTNQVIWYTISATGRKVKSFKPLPVEINKNNWQVYKVGDTYSLTNYQGSEVNPCEGDFCSLWQACC